jgi:hypothetical protein
MLHGILGKCNSLVSPLLRDILSIIPEKTSRDKKYTFFIMMLNAECIMLEELPIKPLKQQQPTYLLISKLLRTWLEEGKRLL